MTCMKGLVMTEHFPSAADVAPLMESFDERLARILLTECMESANALMTALLKGFDGAYPASQALHALLAIAVASNEAAESRAWSAAERVFILGTARWGAKRMPVAWMRSSMRRRTGSNVLNNCRRSTPMSYKTSTPSTATIRWWFPEIFHGRSPSTTLSCVPIGLPHLRCGCKETFRR